MKEVLIRRYGWLEILQINGNYALVRSPKGGKFTYNILGHETRNKQQKLF